ncbi:MAG: N-acetylmuramoyl-L-alanine amidase [bacterium]|nr:N-acetylmuramoyl-L-alanine amidase [bacterium]MCM1376201.1 N-acetylmuramoyl-L-alanine amidase [Muribaculum sp.]
MGALYNEEEELDFSFLRANTRQQPRGAAAGRRTNEQMIYSTSERRQGQARQTRSGQARAVRAVDGRSRSRQGSAGRDQGVQRRTSQSRPAQGQAGNRRSQTMQEKQAIRLARRKRRLRRQRQLLAILLGILFLGSAYAVWQLRAGVEAKPYAETGNQGMGQTPEDNIGAILPERKIQGIAEGQFNQHPSWTEDFLTVSEYSRPGEPLEEVKNIFVHYTANLNTSAAQNRSYFEHLKDNHDVRGASAHFIIGIEGEILQIVPLDEIAYAVQTRNEDSISIECCYKYENGQFTQETYTSLIKLLVWLADTYDLEADDILRHYDCGGKKCPLYYVENEDAWRLLKQDVEEGLATVTR